MSSGSMESLLCPSTLQTPVRDMRSGGGAVEWGREGVVATGVGVPSEGRRLDWAGTQTRAAGRALSLPAQCPMAVGRRRVRANVTSAQWPHRRLRRRQQRPRAQQRSTTERSCILATSRPCASSLGLVPQAPTLWSPHVAALPHPDPPLLTRPLVPSLSSHRQHRAHHHPSAPACQPRACRSSTAATHRARPRGASDESGGSGESV